MSNTPDTNKEREAFETLVRKRWGGSDRGELTRKESGYATGPVDFAWSAFQAGRASLAASAGSEPVAGIYQLSPLASAHETITEVINELRTYNPQADEHGGKFIHKGWANQLEAVAPPQVSESESESWLRNRALILRAIEERGLQLVNSGGLFWLAGSTHPSPQEGAAAEQALLRVLDVTRRYLPPDGPSAHDAMSEILAIVDPWPLGPLEK